MILVNSSLLFSVTDSALFCNACGLSEDSDWLELTVPCVLDGGASGETMDTPMISLDSPTGISMELDGDGPLGSTSEHSLYLYHSLTGHCTSVAGDFGSTIG